ncbi:DUF1771-domain-containing protein [Auriculariales sp. MPI-PUGE-AT-0066]|nr:DUF1771-domain-containing protein [Auriculariales sp. MPI-PUGE-AT-0066]
MAAVFTVLLKLLNGLCGGQKADPEPQQPQSGAGYPGQQNHQQYPPAQQQQPWHQQKPHQQKPHQQQPQHQQPQQPPYHAPSPPHTGSSPPTHQEHHKSDGRVNENMQNQQNPWYLDMRAKANKAGDGMARCFDESKQAYGSGDGARAKQLSEEGKAHKAEMESCNAQAAEWIFQENNTDSAPGEVDLHGLYVKEAIHYADRAVQEAKNRGETSIRIIVGKGMHSKGGKGKLGPAIEEVMQKHQIEADFDPHNAGVLVVRLGGARQQRGVGAGELERKIENDRDECVIM